MPKPASTLMKFYRVRVDGEADESVIAFCKKYSERYLLVHHTTLTENPHYHFYIETTLTQGNFSNCIKTALNVNGTDYSNKACSPDRMIEYLSYLFNTKKGNVARVVSYDGFSVIDISTYMENSKRIAKEFSVRMSSEKKTQFDIAQIVLERLGKDDSWHPSVIYDVVIDVLKANHQIARPFVVRDLISTVMAYSTNMQAQNDAKHKILEYFR